MPTAQEDENTVPSPARIGLAGLQMALGRARQAAERAKEPLARLKQTFEREVVAQAALTALENEEAARMETAARAGAELPQTDCEARADAEREWTLAHQQAESARRALPRLERDATAAVHQLRDLQQQLPGAADAVLREHAEAVIDDLAEAVRAYEVALRKLRATTGVLTERANGRQDNAALREISALNGRAGAVTNQPVDFSITGYAARVRTLADRLATNSEAEMEA